MTLRGDMMGECKPLPILSTRMAKIPKTNTHPIQKTILVKQLVMRNGNMYTHLDLINQIMVVFLIKIRSV